MEAQTANARGWGASSRVPVSSHPHGGSRGPWEKFEGRPGTSKQLAHPNFLAPLVLLAFLLMLALGSLDCPLLRAKGHGGLHCLREVIGGLVKGALTQVTGSMEPKEEPEGRQG